MHTKCLLSAIRYAKFAASKSVMPVITLQIPVSDLLETIRQLLADGKDVREELLSTAMGGIDCNSSLTSSQNLPNSQ